MKTKDKCVTNFPDRDLDTEDVIKFLTEANKSLHLAYRHTHETSDDGNKIKMDISWSREC